MLQGISLKKRGSGREKERKIEEKTWGDQASARPKSFIFQKVLLYLALYIEGNERCKVIQSQPKYSSSIALSKPGFFCIPFPQKMLCTVSSGLGGR